MREIFFQSCNEIDDFHDRTSPVSISSEKTDDNRFWSNLIGIFFDLVCGRYFRKVVTKSGIYLIARAACRLPTEKPTLG